MTLRRRMNQSLEEIKEDLNRKTVLLERLDAAIVTAYPESHRSTEEFESLRKAIFGGVRAEKLHEKSLITVVRWIDEGAEVSTVRRKTLDLLEIHRIRELTPSEAKDLPSEVVALFFRVVGDEASERSAWIRESDAETSFEVVERGDIAELPPKLEDVPVESLASSARESDAEQDLETAPKPSDEPVAPAGIEGDYESNPDSAIAPDLTDGSTR
jgi:hypothetical protein